MFNFPYDYHTLFAHTFYCYHRVEGDEYQFNGCKQLQEQLGARALTHLYCSIWKSLLKPLCQVIPFLSCSPSSLEPNLLPLHILSSSYNFLSILKYLSSLCCPSGNVTVPCQPPHPQIMWSLFVICWISAIVSDLWEK